MSEDGVRAAIRAIREFGVSYGPRETTIKVALMEGVIHEIMGTAARALEMPSLPRPDSLDEKALLAMWDGANARDKGGFLHGAECMRAAYTALYERLTKPKAKTASERLRESVDTFRANGSKEFSDLANMARALADFADELLARKP